MAFEPGDVVFLKSGGQPMTVAAVEEASVECLWLGEDGELFRESIPSVTLTAAPDATEDDLDDESEDESDDEGDDEEPEATDPPAADAVKTVKSRKRA